MLDWREIMLEFNKGKFSSLKSSVTRSGKALQGNIQKLIEMGFSHYLETGDTVYLNQAMAVAIATKTIRTIAMQAYIQQVANVHWTEVKLKKGKIHVFKKNLNEDGTKPEAVVDVVYVNATTWYDHAESLGQDKPDMNFNAQLKSLITRTKTAINDGHIEDPDVAEVALVELEKLVKAA